MTPATDPPTASPQQVAEACRDAMWKNDHATKLLGMRIEAVGPGSATLSMTVRSDMLNGHATCHGGLLTSLADSAFGFACNAYNEASVAAGFDVNLMAPGREGDVLTAVARELSKTGRTGVYDVEVRNQRGELLTVFRGRSYTLKGKALVPGLPMGKPAPKPI
jgi:acyl-CoA thioesterase